MCISLTRCHLMSEFEKPVLLRGTDSSNPGPSSEESANFRSLRITRSAPRRNLLRRLAAKTRIARSRASEMTLVPVTRPGAGCGCRVGLWARHRIDHSRVRRCIRPVGPFCLFAAPFDIVRYGGAVYLIYLGISGVISGGVAGAVANASGRGRPSLINSY